MADAQLPAGAAVTRCRNCGRPAGPRFCGSCGQPLDDRRRPLRKILGEILSDWLSLDGRLLLSLTAYLGGALHRVHPQAWWRTTARILLLTLIYSQLMNWAVGMAVGAAIWQV